MLLVKIVAGKAALVGAGGAKARIFLLGVAVVVAGIGGVAIAQHGPTCVEDVGVNMPTAQGAAEHVVANLSDPDHLTKCMDVSDPGIAADVAKLIAEQGASPSLSQGLVDGADYEFSFTDKKLQGFGIVVAGSNKRTLRAPSSQPYWKVDIYSLDGRLGG